MHHPMAAKGEIVMRVRQRSFWRCRCHAENLLQEFGLRFTLKAILYLHPPLLTIPRGSRRSDVSGRHEEFHFFKISKLH
jgi:hypothetical protein